MGARRLGASLRMRRNQAPAAPRVKARQGTRARMLQFYG
jgi:hypothetical protein